MRRVVLVGALVFAVVYLVPLGVRPLYSPDETRYAELPREMLASGDWVVPHLNGLRYFEKTPLGYWAMAASMSILGETELAVRLPTAISAALTAVLILLLVCQSSARPRAGLLAAGIYLTFLEVYVVGNINILDSILTLFVTGSIISIFLALEATSARARTMLLVVGGILCGLAFLTKGFLALAVPALVLGPFLLMERRLRDLVRAPWLAIAAAFTVALPWAVMIHVREPDFWWYFFWTEHVQRFLSPVSDNLHAEPFWYFVPVLVVSAAPWLPLLPAGISGLRSKPSGSPLVRLCLVWFAVPFLFFSVSGGKLAPYILPCHPALAILLGLGIDAYLERKHTRLFTAGAVVTAAVAVAVLLGVAVAGRAKLPPEETWKWLVALAALAWWAALALAAARARRPRVRLALMCSAPLAFMLSAPVIVPREAEEGKAFGRFIARHAAQLPAGATVVTDDLAVHALCWYLKRDDLYVLGRAGELSYGLTYADSSHRLLDDADLFELVDTAPGDRDVVVVLKQGRLDALRQRHAPAQLLPPPSFEVTGDGLVLARWAPRPADEVPGPARGSM